MVLKVQPRTIYKRFVRFNPKSDQKKKSQAFDAKVASQTAILISSIFLKRKIVKWISSNMLNSHTTLGALMTNSIQIRLNVLLLNFIYFFHSEFLLILYLYVFFVFVMFILLHNFFHIIFSCDFFLFIFFYSF